MCFWGFMLARRLVLQTCRDRRRPVRRQGGKIPVDLEPVARAPGLSRILRELKIHQATGLLGEVIHVGHFDPNFELVDDFFRNLGVGRILEK